MDEFEKLLNKIYYIDKNFDGAKELYRKARLENKQISLDYVSDWLKKQSVSQQTTKTKIGKHEFLSIYSEDSFSYQIDLTFLPKYKSANKQNYVLFTAININSRYAFASFGKDKSTETVLNMLEKFKKEAKTINTITCDSGSEFTNKKVSQWFDKEEISLFFVVGDSHKLGIINRFHRTLKNKLNKMFLATDNYNWIDNIDQIINNYNNTVNTGIGYRPVDATNELIQSAIVDKIRTKNEKLEKKNIQEMYVGDSCRIALKKKIFDKIREEYSNKFYKITKINKNTVNVSNDDITMENVKKSDITIVNAVENPKEEINKKALEKQARFERRMKREGLDTSLNFV